MVAAWRPLRGSGAGGDEPTPVVVMCSSEITRGVRSKWGCSNVGIHLGGGAIRAIKGIDNVTLMGTGRWELRGKTMQNYIGCGKWGAQGPGDAESGGIVGAAKVLRILQVGEKSGKEKCRINVGETWDSRGAKDIRRGR